ncbi:MAG: tetratricopeptide repeat protein [Methanomicrobiales archaeon]|nr:tetratricopeptide repeat protein [Methanomicrobiales archaeon]
MTVLGSVLLLTSTGAKVLAPEESNVSVPDAWQSLGQMSVLISQRQNDPWLIIGGIYVFVISCYLLFLLYKSLQQVESSSKDTGYKNKHGIHVSNKGARYLREDEPANVTEIFLLRNAETLVEQGNYNRAIDYYDQAIALSPGSAMGWYGRGNVFRKKDDYQNAIESYKTALKLDPYSADIWMNLGDVMEKTGKEKESRICYARAARLYNQ